jgi:hypothetical protein
VRRDISRSGGLTVLAAYTFSNFFVTEIARGNVFAFINSFLRLCPPDPKNLSITDLFWKQIEWMQPDSYFATGADCLLFATRNRALFATVRAALEVRSAVS